jgi:hypothetical protein
MRRTGHRGHPPDAVVLYDCADGRWRTIGPLKVNLTDVRRWATTGDSRAAAGIRRAGRAVLRALARLRSGSVSAEMDRVVAEALTADTGSGLPPELLGRRRSFAVRRRRSKVRP